MSVPRHDERRQSIMRWLGQSLATLGLVQPIDACGQAMPRSNQPGHRLPSTLIGRGRRTLGKLCPSHRPSLTLLLCLGIIGAASAQEPAPNVEEAQLRLFEDEEHDELVLNDEERTLVKVRPIEAKQLGDGKLAERRPVDPTSFPRGKKLVVRQLDNPLEDYEVKWGDIEALRLFEFMILEQATALVREGRDNPGKFDEAYDYFKFLKEKFPDLEGLKEALSDYLYEDAASWFKRGKYENAHALLNELYEVNPEYSRLPARLGDTTEKLMEPYLARDDYPAARRFLGRLAKKFPANPVVARYHEKWAEEARQFIAQGRQQIAAGDPRSAWDLAQRVLYVWPKSPDAKSFFEDLYAAWPRVVVGVTAPHPAIPQPRLANWGTRRAGRLLNRMLVEFAGTGAEGGRYECPIGQLEKADIGRRLIFRLKRGIKESAAGDALTGFDLSRQLRALADPRQNGFEPTWSELLGGVSVQDVYQVDAELRWSYVQPLALLETPVTLLKAGAAPQGVGPFLLGKSAEGKTHFLTNGDYFARQPGQLSEIVEQYVPNSEAAWTAMERGQVRLIDRLAPWEVERYRGSRDYAVGQYALPTIHCLMPNLDRPFTKNKYFRRAIAYAIDRNLVVKHHLLKDEPLGGYQLVSGPFPVGSGFKDPLNYAYNNEVGERQRNPRLALTLAEVALKEINEAAKKREEPEFKEFPTLLLAHPANDIAREACKGIKRHIEGLKFKVALREIEPGMTVPSDGNYDLVYLEMTMQEPLVDAARLLSPDGIVGEASPYMTLALVQLARAINWQDARQILQRIHRLTDEDMSVIPLWQMNEYFAYHRSLKGMNASPVLLYESVENWKSSAQVPVEDY